MTDPTTPGAETTPPATEPSTPGTEPTTPPADETTPAERHQYDECGGYTAFTSQGKPVFNAEYAARYRNNTGGARDALCRDSATLNIRTLVLPLKLDGSFRYSCSQ